MVGVDGVAARAARPGEAAAALEVWRRANIARGKAPGMERIARVRDKLTDPAALVTVAVDGGCVVGMVLAEPGRDRDGAGEPLPELCHMSMVFVDPEHWGRRIGRVLLDAVAGQAAGRGYRRLQVWTGQGNERALRLYRRTGFEPSGRTDRLGSGERVIHLVRRLPGPEGP